MSHCTDFIERLGCLFLLKSLIRHILLINHAGNNCTELFCLDNYEHIFDHAYFNRQTVAQAPWTNICQTCHASLEQHEFKLRKWENLLILVNALVTFKRQICVKSSKDLEQASSLHQIKRGMKASCWGCSWEERPRGDWFTCNPVIFIHYLLCGL